MDQFTKLRILMRGLAGPDLCLGWTNHCQLITKNLDHLCDSKGSGRNSVTDTGKQKQNQTTGKKFIALLHANFSAKRKFSGSIVIFVKLCAQSRHNRV